MIKVFSLKIWIGILIVVICGVFGLLATRTWEPTWSPFRPSPEETLAEMPERMKEVKTCHTEAICNLDFENERKFEISGEVKADQDLTNLKKPKQSSGFEIKLITNGTQYTLAGETKIINKTSYLKLTKIPTIPLLGVVTALLKIDISKMKNQWIKIDFESLAKKMEVPPEELEKLKTKFKEQEETREKIIRKLKEILKEKEFFKVEKELPDQKINGIQSYHYMVSFDKQKVKKAWLEILEFLPQQASLQGQAPLPVEEPDWENWKKKVSKNLDEFFEKISQIKGEIWIGKKDYLTRRIKFKKEIDLEKFESKGKLRMELKINLSKFNQKIKIEKPEKAKPIEELFEVKEGFLGSLGKTRQTARDNVRRADMRRILVAMEIYYREHSAYLASKTYPKAIGGYVPITPTDPKDGTSYGWVDNTGNDQKFCVYDDLERGGCVLSSHAGTFTKYSGDCGTLKLDGVCQTGF